jgi:3-oxoacyl-[acyl-carrier-protein] synthase-3
MEVNFEYTSLSKIILATARPTLKDVDAVGLYIARKEQTTSDLGFEAAVKIIAERNIDINEIGGLLFLSRTADYRGPATAMVLQSRLGIPKDAIVYDAPTGNSGFELGMHLGTSLLLSTNKKYVLVIFGDTTSKILSQTDSVQLHIQDAATALLMEKAESTFNSAYHSYTLSNLWQQLMIPSGGFRNADHFFLNLPHKRKAQLPSHLHLDLPAIVKELKNELLDIHLELKALYTKVKSEGGFVILNCLCQELEDELILQMGADNDQHIIASNRFQLNSMSCNTPLMLEEVLSKKTNKPVLIASMSIGEGVALNISTFYINPSDILSTHNTGSFFQDGAVSHEI